VSIRTVSLIHFWKTEAGGKTRVLQNQGYQRDYTEKSYDVDQSGLPGTYFDTLVTAFEEHLAVAEAVDEIHQEALSNITQGG
jgi:hypothetical protein